MDNSTFKGKWNELRGLAKQRWTNLTDDDLLYEEGREDDLYGRIEQRTGEPKHIVRGWFDREFTKL